MSLTAPLTMLDNRKIFLALENGDIDRIWEILTENNLRNNDQDKDGTVPLVMATRRRMWIAVQIIINSGANLNTQDKQDGSTSLMVAVKEKEIDIVRSLLSCNASVDIQDKDARTALMFGARSGCGEIVDMLIKSNASTSIQDNEGWSALMFASYNGHITVVEMLISNKANIDLKNKDGWTAAMMAAHTGKLEILQLLYEGGAKLDTQNRRGATAMMLAASRGHGRVIDFLLKSGANCHLKDACGEYGILPKPRVLESTHPYECNTRDYYPVEIPGADKYEIVFDERCQLDGPSDYIEFYEGQSYSSHSGIIKYSGSCRGNSHNFPGVNGNPSLIITTKTFMMYFNTDFRSKDNFFGYKIHVIPYFNPDPERTGWTALHWAAYKGTTDCAELLLDAGVEVDVQGWDGKTALAWAIERDNEATAISIMRKGARVDIPDKEGLTALELAMKKEHKAFLRALIKNFKPFIDNTGNFAEGSSYIWTYLLSTKFSEYYVEEVSEVLTTSRHRIKLLAEVEDEGGRKLIGIAQPLYKAAIMEKLYFYKRYELKEGQAEHKSATCIVMFAKDHGHKGRSVALKFMREKEQFNKEWELRKRADFSANYVMGILEVYDGDVLTEFKNEVESNGYYPYCLVMDAADRNLGAIVNHEHFAGRDWDRIRHVSKELTEAVHHFHSKGFVHGDIKPLNIMRFHDGRLRLIDLDASEEINQNNYMGSKYSSAFVPPEMVALVSGPHGEDEAIIKALKTTPSPKCLDMQGLPYEPLHVNIEYDMWSLGATLYQVFTGECLFNANDENNIDQKQLLLLYEWSDSVKNEKLEKIKDPKAKNFLARLLNKVPKKRPDSAHALDHPFLSGKISVRLFGEAPKYDFFISYRVASDFDHASKIYKLLVNGGKRVYFDKECLVPGQPWEDGFCDGVSNSRVFVPIISFEGIYNISVPRQNFGALNQESSCDNVFLEHRLAVELKEMGLFEAIAPVLVAELTGVGIEETLTYRPFDRTRIPSLADVSVNSIEIKTREHLDRQGLGAPIVGNPTIRSINLRIMEHQGCFLNGFDDDSYQSVAEFLIRSCDATEKTDHSNPTLTSSSSCNATEKTDHSNPALTSSSSVSWREIESIQQENVVLLESLHYLEEYTRKGERELTSPRLESPSTTDVGKHEISSKTTSAVKRHFFSPWKVSPTTSAHMDDATSAPNDYYPHFTQVFASIRWKIQDIRRQRDHSSIKHPSNDLPNNNDYTHQIEESRLLSFLDLSQYYILKRRKPSLPSSASASKNI